MEKVELRALCPKPRRVCRQETSLERASLRQLQAFLLAYSVTPSNDSTPFSLNFHIVKWGQ